MSYRMVLTYYPWITQSISGKPLADAVQNFAMLLKPGIAEELDVEDRDITLDVPPAMEVADQVEDICVPHRSEPHELKPAGWGKIGLMNPLGYACAHSELWQVESVVVVRRRIGAEPAGPTYKSQIYVNVESEIESVDGLRNRSIAFGSPQSTSNFLTPAYFLQKRGMHPLVSFSRVEFMGGHDKAAIAVYEGRVDAGAGHDGVITDLAGRPGYGDAELKLKRIAWCDEKMISDPVVVHASSVLIRDAIKRALLNLAKPNDQGSRGNRAVMKFWGTAEGFQPIGADDYNMLLDCVAALGIQPKDLIQPWY